MTNGEWELVDLSPLPTLSLAIYTQFWISFPKTSRNHLAGLRISAWMGRQLVTHQLVSHSQACTPAPWDHMQISSVCTSVCLRLCLQGDPGGALSKTGILAFIF